MDSQLATMTWDFELPSFSFESCHYPIRWPMLLSFCSVPLCNMEATLPDYFLVHFVHVLKIRDTYLWPLKREVYFKGRIHCYYWNLSLTSPFLSTGIIPNENLISDLMDFTSPFSNVFATLHTVCFWLRLSLEKSSVSLLAEKCFYLILASQTQRMQRYSCLLWKIP